MGPALDPTAHGARVGRPRDPQIDAAVLDATLAVLDESGYGRLTLEEVARHAGTTKPAIYRRWPSRQQLVLAALGLRLGDARAPDTGCTLCDLHEWRGPPLLSRSVAGRCVNSRWQRRRRA